MTPNENTKPPSNAGTTEKKSDQKYKEFGDYELIEEIARGGMGVVYKARQKKANRLVALKMIRSGELADGEEIKRFHVEAEAAANLDHPGIVPIFDVGEIDGQHYFSMALVEGQNLKKKIEDGPLSPREAAESVLTIAEALAYAHQNGIIHRDLKPQNILIDESGSLRITDFGLAKQIDSDSDLTQSGQIMGTPSYMPPEQAAGKIKEFGPTSDVYSLGAILYELMTGRVPFQASNAIDTLVQVMEQEPVAPRVLNMQVPRDLETICLKCLQKKPNQRYASATDLADELRRFLKGEPIVARAVGPAERAWRWCRRNPVVAALCATVVMVLLTGTIVATSLAIVAQRNAKLAETRAGEIEIANADLDRTLKSLTEKSTALDESNTTLAKANTDLGDALSRAKTEEGKARWQLYVNRITAAQREWESNNMEAAKNHLDACEPELRDWEHDYLYTQFTQGRTDFDLGHRGIVDSIAFSPDSTKLMTGSGQYLKIYDLVRGEELGAMPGIFKFDESAFSSDGTRFLTATLFDGIQLWDASSRSLIQTLEGPEGLYHRVAISSDRKWIAASYLNGMIKVFDANRGKEVFSFKDGDFGTPLLRFGLNDELISAIDNVITVRDLTSGTTTKSFEVGGNARGFTSFALSVDRKQIACGTFLGFLSVYDIETESKLLELKAHNGAVRALSFSFDGKLIATSGEVSRSTETGEQRKGELIVWDGMTGAEVTKLKGHTGQIQRVAFSPDGKLLASVGGGADFAEIKLWNTDRWASTKLKAEGHRVIHPSSESVTISGEGIKSVDVHPDVFQFVSASNRIRMWDGETAKESGQFDDGKVRPIAVAYSANGKQILCGFDDGKVVLLDAETSQEVWSFNVGGAVSCLDFDTSGKRIAIASDENKISILDAETGEEIHLIVLNESGAKQIRFSPDGKTLSIASSSSATIWNAETFKEIRTLQTHSVPIKTENQAFAFSPDGRRLVTASDQKTAKVWDVQSGEALLTLTGHSGTVTSAAFNPEGTRIATGSSDKTIKIWDAATGKIVLTLNGHTESVTTLNFTADEKRLISGSNDATLRIWDAWKSAEEGK